MIRPPRRSTLFPYPPLSRSHQRGRRTAVRAHDRKSPALRSLRHRHDRRRALDGEDARRRRSEEHTSELQSQSNLVCRLLLEKKKQPCIQLCTASINIITRLL